jgi:ABC-2 type transport system permease protein
MASLFTSLFKYLHLVKLFWVSSIATQLEYRLNFVFAALGSLGGLAGSLFSLSLFYRGGYTFAGWRWEEALVVVGFFTLLEGISNAFLASSLDQIVKHVEKGTLDFVLLKPISAQFWLSTHRISLWGIPNILFGAAIIFYAGFKLGLPWTAYFASLVPLACGILILYSLWFMMSTTSVWFTKIYNLTAVLKGILEAGRFPMVAYPVAYQFFFTFIIPIAFLTTIPAEVLLSRGSPQSTAIACLLTLVLLWISNRFWRFALRFYTSASS